MEEERPKLTACALAALLILAACDGAIAVKGVAYRSETGMGRIAVDESVATSGLQPLDGVAITVYHSPKYVDSANPNEALWRNHAVSDVNGRFQTGSTAAPGVYPMAIRAEKPGCTTLTRTFLHDRMDHEVTVFLVCRDRSSF